MVSVIVFAENLIVRVGLENILHANPTLEVVGSFSHIAAIAEAIDERQPDAVLLEWNFSEEETLSEKLLPFSNALGPPAILLLTDNLQNEWLTEALRFGVRGILPRSASANEIVAAVLAAADGVVVLHPEVVEALLNSLPTTARSLPQSPIQALTPREIEVLGMLAEGLGNKHIAKRLKISEHTVKFHVSSIFSKLNASSRTEAVTLGARQGLIML